MLNFNEMLEAAVEAVKKQSKMAQLYQAYTGNGMHAMQVVFKGDLEYPSYEVLVDGSGSTVVKPMNSPYLDCLVIHLPLKTTEVEAEEALVAAGYKDEWTSVTLRAPLYSVVYPPLYIYEIPNVGFIAVDSTDSTNVFPIS